MLQAGVDYTLCRLIPQGRELPHHKSYFGGIVASS
jgi:hypothetical protein